MFSIKKKNNKVKISFVDEPASEDVTGSGVFIETPKHKILLDYGLAQSNNRYNDYLTNIRRTKEFKAKQVDFLFISHLHADHALLAPKLYKDGFSGATIIPNQNKSVLKIMAEDCAFINERDIEVINNQNGKSYNSLYGIEHVNDMLSHTYEKPVNEKTIIDEELSFEFIPSGHLLGGCQIILYITTDGVTKTIGYSGDIGNYVVDNKFVGKFQPIKTCDIFIGESTYGDRPELKTGCKERKNDLAKLKSIIDTQVNEMNGRVVIPSFAQCRCQQLVLMIYQLYKHNTWQPDVYVDSPLAISIFNTYDFVLNGEDKEVLREILQWDKLHFVKDSVSSKELVSNNKPCVIISTSGMCVVGRVRHHIKSLVSNQNATILFVGFSTPGSLASILKDPKTKYISIDGKEYPCRCSCYSLKSMSGHAPYNQLIDYYSSINCKKIILHHGSNKAKEILKKGLESQISEKCHTSKVIIANSSLNLTL